MRLRPGRWPLDPFVALDLWLIAPERPAAWRRLLSRAIRPQCRREVRRWTDVG